VVIAIILGCGWAIGKWEAASRLRRDAVSLTDSFEEDKTLPAAWRRAGSVLYSLKVIVPVHPVKTGLTSGSIS
jgi:hypothetical protein